MIRLDRMLSELGVCTRSEAKKMVRAGRILVNGTAEKNADRKIEEAADEVTVDGQTIAYEPYVYYLLNKPAGVVSASSSEDCRTVIDLVPDKRRGLFPVGRLDKDTEGLLLITNDGGLAHSLLAPGRHVEKEYEVQYAHPLSPADIAALEGGMQVQGEVFQPAVYRPAGTASCRLILQEGKYHEIKRMFEALGNKVVHLKRIRMKNLTLEESLAPGECRPLTAAELQLLREPVLPPQGAEPSSRSSHNPEENQ